MSWDRRGDTSTNSLTEFLRTKTEGVVGRRNSSIIKVVDRRRSCICDLYFPFLPFSPYLSLPPFFYPSFSPSLPPPPSLLPYLPSFFLLSLAPPFLRLLPLFLYFTPSFSPSLRLFFPLSFPPLLPLLHYLPSSLITLPPSLPPSLLHNSVGMSEERPLS